MRPYVSIYTNCVQTAAAIMENLVKHIMLFFLLLLRLLDLLCVCHMLLSFYPEQMKCQTPTHCAQPSVTLRLLLRHFILSCLQPMRYKLKPHLQYLSSLYTGFIQVGLYCLENCLIKRAIGRPLTLNAAICFSILYDSLV